MRSKVLITGAAGGLGRAFSVECARRGWDLFLTDLDQRDLENLAAGLERTYRVSVTYQSCNLMQPESRERLFDSLQEFQFLGLINVAGLDVEGIFLERTRTDIQEIVRLNVEGTLAVTHQVLERMDPMQTFWIVTVSSLAAFYPMPVKATYAASKRFLLDFFLALGDEVASRGASVTVLCPAGLPTTASAVEGIEAQGLLGQLTTQNVGRVAARTIDKVLIEKKVFIPGFLNQTLRWMGSLVPPVLLSRLIGRRWRAAQKLRQELPLSLDREECLQP